MLAAIAIARCWACKESARWLAQLQDYQACALTCVQAAHADVKESSLRKAQRLTRPERMLRGWVSTYRAMTLSYTADFVVASVIDSCRCAHAQSVLGSSPPV